MSFHAVALLRAPRYRAPAQCRVAAWHRVVLHSSVNVTVWNTYKFRDIIQKDHHFPIFVQVKTVLLVFIKTVNIVFILYLSRIYHTTASAVCREHIFNKRKSRAMFSHFYALVANRKQRQHFTKGFKFKIATLLRFHYHIWLYLGKSINMSTNMPGIYWPIHKMRQDGKCFKECYR